jgi:hypothetical protein
MVLQEGRLWTCWGARDAGGGAAGRHGSHEDGNALRGASTTHTYTLGKAKKIAMHILERDLTVGATGHGDPLALQPPRRGCGEEACGGGETASFCWYHGGAHMAAALCEQAK